MTKLNISQAARAAGVSRRTFYRHIEIGKVSCEQGINGEPLIDLSEMQRVYGELQNPDTPVDVLKPEKGLQPDTAPVNHAGQDYIDHLQAEINAWKRAFEEEREERARLVGIIEHQTRMLTYQSPETTKENAEEPPTDPVVEEMKDQIAKMRNQNNYLVHMQRRSWWEKLIGKKYVAPVDG